MVEEICRDKLLEAIAAIEAIEATRLPATLHQGVHESAFKQRTRCPCMQH